MRAEALSRKEGGPLGAVAFSRTGDPATGHFSDAKVMRKFGEVGRRYDCMQLQLLAWNRQWHGCRAILQLARDQRARNFRRNRRPGTSINLLVTIAVTTVHTSKPAKLTMVGIDVEIATDNGVQISSITG
jgi:hypothetical protein